MKTELNVKLDENLVQRAQEYAEQAGITLSRVLENSLTLLLPDKKKKVEKIEISPFVRSIPKKMNIPVDTDIRKEYYEHLYKKYQ